MASIVCAASNNVSARVAALLASEEADVALYREWRDDRRVLMDAVRARDVAAVTRLAKLVPYRALFKAGAADVVPPAVMAAAAARDAARLKASAGRKESQGEDVMVDGVAPDEHWAAAGGAPLLALAPGTKYSDVIHNCYVCRAPYPWTMCLGDWRREDGGHASLCAACGLENLARGQERADLSGWTVVITGCRHTVGLAAALQLLRMGATVIGTTRFPRAALLTFAAEADYGAWRERLTLLEVDFLKAAQLRAFMAWLSAYGAPIDAFVSNAFLTVQQTPAYYATLRALDDLMRTSTGTDAAAALAGPGPSPSPGLLPLALALVPPTCTAPSALSAHAAPSALTDDVVELVVVSADARAPARSEAARDWLRGRGQSINEHGNLAEPPRATLWTEKLADTDPVTLCEATFVNQIAPTLLVQHVCKLMAAHASSRRVLINVTSTEHRHRTSTHVVTGMHKAAMEALWYKLAHERDKAERFVVCSVDPGFVTGVIGERRKPLTSHDGGARVVHPIVRLANGTPLPREVLVWKDYQPYVRA